MLSVIIIVLGYIDLLSKIIYNLSQSIFLLFELERLALSHSKLYDFLFLRQYMEYKLLL